MERDNRKVIPFLFVNLSSQDSIEPDDEEAGGNAVAEETPRIHTVVVFHFVAVIGEKGNGGTKHERADNIGKRLARTDAVPLL